MDRRTVYTVAGLAAAVAIAALAFGRTPRASAESRVPTDPAEVLETLPYAAATDARTKQIAALRRALAQNPQDLAMATRLARLDIQLARERSDPRFLGHAQAALAPWWAEPNAPPTVLVLRATIEQSLHDFDAALVDLGRALTADPENPQAWLTRAVVLTVRGRYDEARQSCIRLVPIATRLVVAVCTTSIDSVTGHAKDALGELGTLLSIGTRQFSPDEVAWASSSLGEFAQRAGDLDAAEKYFEAALAADPDDGYVRAAWADLAIDRGKFEKALELTQGREWNDTLILRLAIAEKRVGDKGAEALIETIGARFDASRLRGDVVHRREEARYWLELRNDPPRALALAKANWDVQKEPWDVRVYLEAARAAKSKDEAVPILAWLDANKLEDPFIAKVAAELRK